VIFLDAGWQELIAFNPIPHRIIFTNSFQPGICALYIWHDRASERRSHSTSERGRALPVDERNVLSPRTLRGVSSTSIGFDLSVYEIFGTLALGGCVILAENVFTTSTLAAAERISLINTVPSAMTELLRQNGLPPAVETVNLAGEPLTTHLVGELYRIGTIRG